MQHFRKTCKNKKKCRFFELLVVLRGGAKSAVFLHQQNLQYWSILNYKKSSNIADFAGAKKLQILTPLSTLQVAQKKNDIFLIFTRFSKMLAFFERS